MLGVWDYTVILTYASLVSAMSGVLITLNEHGHPYIGMFCLLICGLCDTFDGRVARRKKNRTNLEKNFGVQIDSLSDLVAFGVLPACIGMALYKSDNYLLQKEESALISLPVWFVFIVCAFFALMALVRLAYFNVTVEETQGQNVEEKYYYGLPVTSSALVFPTILIVNYCTKYNISFLYVVGLIAVGVLYVCKFKLKKPSSAIIYSMLGVGLIEFIVLIFMKVMEMNIIENIGNVVK